MVACLYVIQIAQVVYMSRLLNPKDDRLHEEKFERATTHLLRKNIMDVLNRHYPHVSTWPVTMHSTDRATPWAIDILDFPTGGIVTIKNLLFSGKMGVSIRLKSLDPEGKVIVRHVGEYLERYNVARSKGLDMREKLLGMPRDFRGEAVAERG